jgi:RNA polymerase sigma-70 factor (ECF subfamily)
MPDQAPGEPDEQLVARSRQGDRDAFGELVRRWQRPLFARAMRGAHGVEAADDLVQETFLRAWKGLKHFRGDAQFGAWTLRILSNLLADRGRAGRNEASPEAAMFELVRDPGPNPEEALLATELSGMLHAALTTLPEGRQREVFRMRFVEGRTIQDIAREFGVHTGTVKVHLFRLVRELRARLAGRKERP